MATRREGEAWLASPLFAAIAATLFALAVEVPHYARALGEEAGAGPRAERLAVAWLLIAKSLLPLLPFQALALAAARTRFAGLARRLLTAVTVALVLWLVLDLWVQSHYGSHLASYLPFIGSALRSREQIQWVGDPLALATSLALLIAATALACALLHAVARVAARTLSRRAALGVAALYAAFVLGALPVQRIAVAPELRKRVAMSLPYSLDWATRDARGAADLNLLGVVPSPWRSAELTEVMIHNSAPAPRSAEGWRIENAAGQRVPLHGDIDAGATRHFEIAKSSFALSRVEDAVALLGPEGAVHGRVAYRDEDVKRGAVLWNPLASSYAESALARIGAAAQGAYQDNFSRIAAPRVASLAPGVVARADAPNVILLVVESFRSDVVGPSLLTGLAALGERGLHASRHYSGSNSSHLGLFSLLYARLPLVYDAVLDGGAPPAAVSLFRQLGYRAAFISSGEIESWKRMDQFLGLQVFDTVELHTAKRDPRWQQWPDCDRDTLAAIRALLAQPGPHFIVGFLMTTHFPYPYPAAFERFTPVSHEDELPSWDQIFRAPLDREKLWNRYRNAALSLEAQLTGFAASLDPAHNVIAITGDHGESFGDDGALVHGSRASDAQTRVPLLIFGGGVANATVAGPSGHVDVLPTLLHAATGVADPARGLDGRDLLSAAPRDALFVAPYKLTQPYDLLWLRGDRRVLLHARADRPQLEAFAFVDASGFPLLERDPSVYADADALAAAIAADVAQLGGPEPGAASASASAR